MAVCTCARGQNRLSLAIADWSLVIDLKGLFHGSSTLGRVGRSNLVRSATSEIPEGAGKYWNHPSLLCAKSGGVRRQALRKAFWVGQCLGSGAGTHGRYHT